MLRFTIRDLFWLTLVAAACVSWWVEHHRGASRLAVEAELRKQLAVWRVQTTKEIDRFYEVEQERHWEAERRLSENLVKFDPLFGKRQPAESATDARLEPGALKRLLEFNRGPGNFPDK